MVLQHWCKFPSDCSFRSLPNIFTCYAVNSNDSCLRNRIDTNDKIIFFEVQCLNNSQPIEVWSQILQDTNYVSTSHFPNL